MLRTLERHWWWLAVLGALAGEVACSSPPDEPARPGRPVASHDLEYRRVEHLPTLDEDITVIKTPDSVSAIRASGREQPLLEVRAEERAAKLARWGALDPSFDPALQAAPASAQLPVAFHFDPHVDWTRITPALHDPAARPGAQGQLLAAIDRGAQQLAAELTVRGVQAVWYRPTIPIVFGLADATTIRGLARHPDLTLISSNEPGRVELHAGPPNTISDPQIDTGMNAIGLFGAGQSVGFLEEAKCGLYDPHEAFSLAGPITYEVEPMDCKTDFDCGNCDLGGGAMCLPLGHPGHPLQCVAVHASETASCVSATRSGSGNGAFQASLFHPNAGGPSPLSGHPTSVACSASGTVDAYDWLTKKGVTTANESWGCSAPLGAGTAATLEGLAEDWYARNFGISIFKSAGNRPDMSACPFTLNSICVGGTNVAHAMSCFSSWRNPAGPGGRKQSDREEPDITALAGEAGSGCSIPLAQVDVMEVGNPTGWTGNDGTSFASPAMAGFAALLKEACGGNLDEKLVRVIMRNAAWPRNPTGWRYSTPQPGFDHKDGAGSPIAEAAVAFCRPTGGGPDNKSGLDPGDLHHGHPGPKGDPPPTGAPPGEQRSAGAPGPSDGRLYDTFFQTNFRTGDRIRVSFAFDSCPVSSSGTAPATVATDYDLFLYNETTGTYVYSSQSFDDSTEGFDVTIPSDGLYTVYYAWPSGASGCGGSGFEPFGWAVTWWH
jgi:hypothetical protein